MLATTGGKEMIIYGSQAEELFFFDIDGALLIGSSTSFRNCRIC
jgi:hypothetical protein